LRGTSDKMSVTIAVPMIPPAANSYARMHWGERARHFDAWRRTVYGLMGVQERAWLMALCRAKRKMRVEICFNHKRFYDPDNLVAVCKIPLDVLRRLEFLANDDVSKIDLHVSQEKLNAKVTRIYIAEAA
jgi:hypothetical protein